MGHPTDARREVVLKLAAEIIDAAAPGLLTMTHVASCVGEQMGMSLPAARRYLRASVQRGLLVEFRPDERWRVIWPAAAHADVGTIRIAVQLYKISSKQEATRLVLATDLSGLRTRQVGPRSNLTFVTAEKHARLFLARAKKMQKHHRAPALQ